MDEPTIADELNNQQLWHKVAGALVARAGGDLTLSGQDFAPLEGMCVVVSHEKDGTIMRLRVLPQAEADRLAADFQRAAKRKH